MINIDNPNLDDRRRRALLRAEFISGNAKRVKANHEERTATYHVDSASEVASYTVNLRLTDAETLADCNCPAGAAEAICKHQLAALKDFDHERAYNPARPKRLTTSLESADEVKSAPLLRRGGPFGGVSFACSREDMEF